MAMQVASANLSPAAAITIHEDKDGAAEGGARDPFSATPNSKSPRGHRYSSFDTKLFSSFTRDSPTQTKRALEAHIADTDRRIKDASKLGITLLEQRKQLAESLKEVEQQQGDDEIKPELHQKLTELEKEYNEVGRETARAFLPKSSRSLSSEVGSPSVLSTGGHPSPSKPQALQSRKQRNQASTRVKDLEFATEISSSLLGQVRHLQALLAERDAVLKRTEDEKARLESDANGYIQRLRGIDESEQKFKDENWNLETQVQDLTAAIKESSTREQHLLQSLSATKAEKSNAEKEFEELKVNHNKLSDEHAAIRKLHESEIASMRRNVSSGDHEREQLQRKLDEVTSHNQDLARAVAYRSSRNNDAVIQDDVFDDANSDLENVSPERSPPPSPSKGTPRHVNLESDTLKGSLTHAHRAIQNLKNTIHREKQEKIELKRMLQDARDELESRRANGAATGASKTKKATGQALFKKPARPEKLGGAKYPSEEIINDSTWEEYEGDQTNLPGLPNQSTKRWSVHSETTESYQTANEKDSTATENESFETVAESLAGDDSDDLTETEEMSNLRARAPGLVGLPARTRMSMESTASDDADMYGMQTPPTGSQQRYRLKVNRGGFRRVTDTDSTRGSPASFISNLSQPAAGQSLAAELEDINDDGSSVLSATPGRSVVSREVSPELQRRRVTALMAPAEIAAPKAETVDSGMLTEPWEPAQKAATVDTSTLTEVATVGTIGAAVVGTSATTDGVDREVLVPLPKTTLDFSPISTQDIEPVEPETFSSDSTESLLEPPKKFDFSSILSLNIEPIEPQPASGALTRGLSTEAIIFATVQKRPISPPTAASARPLSSYVVENDQENDVSKDAHHNIQTHKHAKSSTSSSRSSKRKSARDLVVSEDETKSENAAVSASDAADESRVPFKQISGNAGAPAQTDNDGTAKALRRYTMDEGTQTTVSADQIENLLKERNKKQTFAPSTPGSPAASIKRPGSSGSLRKDSSSPVPVMLPPLPADHKKVIAAATSRTSSSTTGSMGPPGAPASAYKAQSSTLRPQTPKGTTSRHSSGLTPRNRTASLSSRRSSVSSFASELDERFGIRTSRGVTMPDGFEVSSADPRMIQAITQTMIGEFLWKYTRKAGRGEISEKRHRRFFWIHPYTRTLYWSDSDPSTAGRLENKAKSVAIEAVRVVSDNNPIPPGLHNKSLVVLTPGRQIKFTALTAQRHETWFNALSYLLVRNAPEDVPQQVQPSNNYSNYSNTNDVYDQSENDFTTGGGSEVNHSAGDLTMTRPVLRSTSSNRSISSINNERSSHAQPTISARGRSMPPNSSLNGSASSRYSTAGAASKRSQRTSSATPSKTLIEMIAESEQSRNGTPTPTAKTSQDIDGREAFEDEDATPKPARQASVSMSQTVPKSPGRLGSMTSMSSKWRPGSFMSFRGRSTRTRDDEPDAEAGGAVLTINAMNAPTSDATPHQHTARGVSVDSRASRMSRRSTGMAGFSSGHGAVENVRACCDGKHDVGSLSHRASSTHRHGIGAGGSVSSKHASISSRTSVGGFMGLQSTGRRSQQSLV